jgi:phospholipase/carboxylesterase
MTMRLQMTSRINAGGDDPIFLMFHGYGNDESEMVRILDAVYAPARFHTDLSLSSAPVGSSDFADSDYSVNHAESAHGETGPSYISFRATYPRPYMGGNYWYPDGCGVEDRQRECAAVGEAVTSLLDASAFANRKKILIGFSQGGYLSYRLVKAYPTVFDSAILLSPSFMGEEQAALDSLTRFFLAYGAYDRTIPAPDQQTAHQVLERAGLLTYREYPDMAHAICDEEIADIRDFLRAI